MLLIIYFFVKKILLSMLLFSLLPWFSSLIFVLFFVPALFFPLPIQAFDFLWPTRIKDPWLAWNQTLYLIDLCGTPEVCRSFISAFIFLFGNPPPTWIICLLNYATNIHKSQNSHRKAGELFGPCGMLEVFFKLKIWV